jgi:DNA-binding beta-propeller fold protein YncE
MNHNILTPLLLSSLLYVCPASTTSLQNSIELTLQGRYHSNIFDQSAAEIVTYDNLSKQTFVINAQSGRVDVINSENINALNLNTSLNIKADLQKHLGVKAGAANSVDVSNGLLAVAVEAQKKTDSGWVAFYNSQNLTFIHSVNIGALPDMLTFTENGKQLIVAIEGEPSNNNYATDPEGEIAIIDIDWQQQNLNIAVTRLTFRDFNVGEKRHHELPQKLILNGYNASISEDLEPEYIAINNNKNKAYITLQENNAIAVVDLTSKSIQKIMALGFKDHTLKGNELDGNNKDNTVNIKN